MGRVHHLVGSMPSRAGPHGGLYAGPEAGVRAKLGHQRGDVPLQSDAEVAGDALVGEPGEHELYQLLRVDSGTVGSARAGGYQRHDASPHALEDRAQRVER
jgi:hypothetical protein